MIYPIYLYGSPLLRKKGEDMKPNHPGLEKLLEDMFETMAEANGIGLAAHQIGMPLNLFCVNFTEWEDDPDTYFNTGGDLCRRVFINAEIYEKDGEPLKYTEGCLSLPNINEEVIREPRIKIRYLDENFEPQDRTFEGMWARTIQHEYDHTQGVMFTDKILPLRKNLIRAKLQKLTKGIHDADYRCKIK